MYGGEGKVITRPYRRTTRKGATVLLILLLALAGFSRPAAAQGEERLAGGIGNEKEYKELFLLSGKPVVLTGQARLTRSTGRDGSLQLRLSYNLKNDAHQVTLTRSLTLQGKEEEALGGRQQITTLEATAFSETARVGQNRYTLREARFSFSRITDRAGAVAYYTADWNGRKVYDVNGNQGSLVVELWGRSIGYDQAWGTTETQHVDLLFSFDGRVERPGEGRQIVTYPQRWSGSAALDLTFNRWRRLDYVANEPVPISFAGGYLETRGEDAVLRYEVDLPLLDSAGSVRSDSRYRDSGSFGVKTTPVYRRLPVPELRDLEGHWSYQEVLRLASLGVLSGSRYFGADLPMTRGQFALALARLLELEPQGQGQAAAGRVGLPLAGTATTGLRLGQAAVPGRGTVSAGGETSPFADVQADSPYYLAVKTLRDRDIVAAGLYFRPLDAVTRAEAVTMVVRALGLEALAPPGREFSTPFRDDAAIPPEARAAVYVAERLGLVGGVPGGQFRPKEKMTRGEAAALLSRTLAYLQDGLRRDYQAVLRFR